MQELSTWSYVSIIIDIIFENTDYEEKYLVHSIKYVDENSSDIEKSVLFYFLYKMLWQNYVYNKLT